MKTIVKDIKDLTGSEYKALRGLNMRHNGMMQQRFARCRKSGVGKVVVVYDDDIIVSWSLLFTQSYTNKPMAYFYTRQKARRKGYGSIVASEVKKIDNNVSVDPWDTRSTNFFRKMGLNR